MNNRCKLGIFEQIEGVATAIVAVMFPVVTLAVLL